MPFANGWHNVGTPFAPARFYQDPYGVVHLEGAITGGSGSFAFTLPPGFRPAFEHDFAVSTETATAMAHVLANGSVMAFNLLAIESLDGISFRTR